MHAFLINSVTEHALLQTEQKAALTQPQQGCTLPHHELQDFAQPRALKQKEKNPFQHKTPLLR